MADIVACVYDETKTYAMPLDDIFKENQHLDSSRPWYEGRSLSMGDLIEVDGRCWAVERVGFKEYPTPRMF